MQAKSDCSAPLVEVLRGPIVESLHRGHIVAVDCEGKILTQLGQPETIVFLRSSVKPLQALPLIISGAYERFSFADKELAIACGSHDGTTKHTEAVLSILNKIGLDESFLKCGPHEPYSKEAAASLRERNQMPTPVHNNCSGKHAALLALALHLRASVKDYNEKENPVQREIKKTIAQFADVPATQIATAIDGCGIPTFALSVQALALMFARLAKPPARFGSATIVACHKIFDAMNAHPDMVEGNGEIDTELMHVMRGALISKVGAEGVYAAGVLPCERWSNGLGLAFKIEDGDKAGRARSPVVIEALSQLGILSSKELNSLDAFATMPVMNHRGDNVGKVRALFQLSFVD